MKILLIILVLMSSIASLANESTFALFLSQFDEKGAFTNQANPSTGFFISADGYFITTSHSSNIILKNRDIDTFKKSEFSIPHPAFHRAPHNHFLLARLQNEKQFRKVSLISHLSAHDSITLHQKVDLLGRIDLVDFVIGKVDLLEAETVPFIKLSHINTQTKLFNPTLKQYAYKAPVLVELIGYPLGKYSEISGEVTYHYDDRLLITEIPISEESVDSGFSGAALLNKEKNRAYGIFTSAGKTAQMHIGVALSTHNILSTFFNKGSHPDSPLNIDVDGTTYHLKY